MPGDGRCYREKQIDNYQLTITKLRASGGETSHIVPSYQKQKDEDGVEIQRNHGGKALTAVIAARSPANHQPVGVGNGKYERNQHGAEGHTLR